MAVSEERIIEALIAIEGYGEKLNTWVEGHEKLHKEKDMNDSAKWEAQEKINIRIPKLERVWILVGICALIIQIGTAIVLYDSVTKTMGIKAAAGKVENVTKQE